MQTGNRVEAERRARLLAAEHDALLRTLEQEGRLSVVAAAIEEARQKAFQAIREAEAAFFHYPRRPDQLPILDRWRREIEHNPAAEKDRLLKGGF